MEQLRAAAEVSSEEAALISAAPEVEPLLRVLGGRATVAAFEILRRLLSGEAALAVLEREYEVRATGAGQFAARERRSI